VLVEARELSANLAAYLAREGMTFATVAAYARAVQDRDAERGRP
jgi:hypothetical protein